MPHLLINLWDTHQQRCCSAQRSSARAKYDIPTTHTTATTTTTISALLHSRMPCIIYIAVILCVQVILPVQSATNVYNVAYGMPVIVEPAEATCGVRGQSFLYGSTYPHYCTVDTQTCAQGRQYPRQFMTHSITPLSNPIEIGSFNCTLSTANTYVNGSWCYLKTNFSMTEYGHSGFTSMMWLRPTSPNG